jgi:hypothetical protein
MPTLAKSTYQSYEIKNKFKPGALDGFSEKMIDQHWMLYKGYVTNVNLLNKTIWDCLEENKELNEPKMAEVLRRTFGRRAGDGKTLSLLRGARNCGKPQRGWRRAFGKTRTGRDARHVRNVPRRREVAIPIAVYAGYTRDQ